jgi:hypothetical protein
MPPGFAPLYAICPMAPPQPASLERFFLLLPGCGLRCHARQRAGGASCYLVAGSHTLPNILLCLAAGGSRAPFPHRLAMLSSNRTSELNISKAQTERGHPPRGLRPQTIPSKRSNKRLRFSAAKEENEKKSPSAPDPQTTTVPAPPPRRLSPPQPCHHKTSIDQPPRSWRGAGRCSSEGQSG